MVMALHRMGCGPHHAEILAAFLNLPPSTQYSYVFRATENELGPILTEIADKSMDDALETEIMATVWEAEEIGAGNDAVFDPHGRAGISASFDEHWPKAGNRRNYNSPAGSGYLIGSLTKMIIGNKVLCKNCRVCDTFGEAVKEKRLLANAKKRKHR